MYVKTRALVLRVIDYNDRDCLLSLLTWDQGKITVKARGLRRKNSRISAACQLLAYGEFTLFEQYGRYVIDEAVAIDLFRELRDDLNKLSLATYFAQVADVMSQEDMPSLELLPLVLNCLYGLSRLIVPDLLIKSVFELCAACLAGFMPDLSGCRECGDEFPSMLDLSGGYMLCDSCRNAATGIRYPVGLGALNAMRYISHCEPKKLFAFYLNEEGIQQLSGLTEAYLTTQFERGFSALDFYKSLLT